jgi:5-methyltetrahydrofolate--homocysteine methyltransferase
MEEHRLNALDFFRGTKWVRKFASCILVVEAMFHSLLEEMIRLGKDAFGFLVPRYSKWMTMGIVNPEMLSIYDEIPKDL